MGKRTHRFLLGAILAVATFCVAPSMALAVGYGLSESPGTLVTGCPDNLCTATYSVFRVGLGGSGAKFVRFVVPYDTIETYNAATGSCDYDYAGSSTWQDLFNALVLAKVQGLTPMLSVSHGMATVDNSGNQLPDKYQNPNA